MEFTNANHPLVQLYGEDALNLAVVEIEKVRSQSNFHFDNDYISLGVSFMNMKAMSLIEENKTKKLEHLVTESFGEAAVAKFNGNLV